mmetsp:Transcript_7620/g.19938  ORF Transcript_7620/g.19938 Transcript_7620/m.19938 type:complete len:84 (-) Transcript_7620:43-294(-)
MRGRHEATEMEECNGLQWHRSCTRMCMACGRYCAAGWEPGRTQRAQGGSGHTVAMTDWRGAYLQLCEEGSNLQHLASAYSIYN